jgi:hypothetical protein
VHILLNLVDDAFCSHLAQSKSNITARLGKVSEGVEDGIANCCLP